MRMKKKGIGGSQSASSSEETPLLIRHQSKKPVSSQLRTLANVVIAIVGAGVLSLPYVFKRCGWLMSLLLLFSIAALTYYCMMLMVHTRRRLVVSRQILDEISSFGDLGFVVCGPVGRLVVDFMILLSQAGFCVGYLIFIANTMINLLNGDLASLGADFAWKNVYIWTCFPFQLGLNSIRSLTHLAPLSIFADIVDLGAKVVVMIKEVRIIWTSRPIVYAFGGISVFFYGVGVATFAFEGAGMVLSIESEMKDRDKFGRVLGLGMALISVSYGIFGLLGYLAFGDETSDIITTNLGTGLISALVQAGLCINLFFSFPVMMHPVHEILERRLWGGAHCLWLRWVAVLLVSLVALLVPNFADFLSLVGSGLCCGLGFVLPALFHFLVFKDDMDWKDWSVDVGIIAVGVVFAVSGTWSSLCEIFNVKR